ncbi:MAG: hypothetical protein JJE04_20230 [Acidobacteriia bacterium]|nr:hypothetical protein [Terriglobia bacterium]
MSKISFLPALALSLLLPANSYAAFGVSPTTMFFLQTAGAQFPPSQTVSIVSTAGVVPLSVSSSGALWLNYSLSFANTPAILSVNVHPTGLDLGTYTATLTVTGTGATNSPVTINVTLQVTSAAPSTVNPAQLAFFYSVADTLPLPSQSFTIGGPGTGYSMSSGVSWISLSSPSLFTPSTVTVSVDPTGLSPGVHNGIITVTHTTIPPLSQLVAVTLNISTTEGLWMTSGPLTFQYHIGNLKPALQKLNVSYITNITFNAQANSTGWLRIEPDGGVTPTTLDVTVDPSLLLAGTYTGTITLSAINVAPTNVKVTLIVSGSPNLTANPSVLEFQVPAGGLPPPAKTVLISSSPATNITTQVVNGLWLNVTPASGITPQALSAGVNPTGLAPGIYRGSIVISSPGAAGGGQLVSVTLTVTAAEPLTITPGGFRFSATVTGPPPPAQVFSVTSPYPTGIAVATSPGWLSITPPNANTPANFSVSVTAAGLPTGIHTGNIIVTAPGGIHTPQSIPVVLDVSGAVPTISQISNGAGLLRDFAPGSTLILYGKDLGPREPAAARLIPGRILETTLGGVRVLINGVPAPLLYVSATQINAMIPFEASGRPRILIEVSYQGLLSETLTVATAETAPILFTSDGSGRGQGAILNQNGSLNSPSIPAPRGSVVVLYGAGGGIFSTPIPTGLVAEGAGPLPLAPVNIFVGGVQAAVLYAGPAPHTVAGILQFNVWIDEQMSQGPAVPLTVKIGEAFSQQGVTLAIQ